MVSASHRVDVLQNTKRGVRAFTISGLYSQLKNKQTNEPIHTQSHEWLKVDMNISESRLVLFVHHPLHPLRQCSPKMIKQKVKQHITDLSTKIDLTSLHISAQAFTPQRDVSTETIIHARLQRGSAEGLSEVQPYHLHRNQSRIFWPTWGIPLKTAFLFRVCHPETWKDRKIVWKLTSKIPQNAAGTK